MNKDELKKELQGIWDNGYAIWEKFVTTRLAALDDGNVKVESIGGIKVSGTGIVNKKDSVDDGQEGKGLRPKVVTLCGSTRFGQAFQDANLHETLKGNIVLSIGCNMKSDHQLFGDLPEQRLREIKIGLDELHKRKIDISDEILVLDVDGYIGESTRSEINYAVKRGLPIRYLSLEKPEGQAALPVADKCPRCKGEGVVEKNVRGFEGEPEYDTEVECPECGGSGRELK